MKPELRKAQKRCRALQKAKLKQESRTASLRIFEKDQLHAVSRRAMNGVKWSSATVKKAHTVEVVMWICRIQGSVKTAKPTTIGGHTSEEATEHFVSARCRDV